MTDVIRNRSVPSPLDGVRNTTKFYYYAPRSIPSVKCLLGVRDVHDDLLFAPLRALFQLCCLYFVRISELLSLQISDVIYPDRVVCTGSKHSRSYCIFVPELSSQINDYSISDKGTYLFPFTYHHCWCWAKKIGFYQKASTNKNAHVLHLGRYIFSRAAAAHFPLSIVTDCMRHRRVGSIFYYLK